MIRITELPLLLDCPPDALRSAVIKRLQIKEAELLDVKIFKRSYDARRKSRAITFVYIVDVSVTDEAATLKRWSHDRHVSVAPDTQYHPVTRAPGILKERPLVIGFGPGGLFAALLLAQMGFKPIVIERGRDVRQRTQDTWALWRRNVLTPESNVQFGEGGAGLFSDGKLYSQIKDPKFYGRKVMREFVKAGAPAEILYVNKPHIGTFRLTGIVAAMRAEITSLGGEIRFDSRVNDFLLDQGQIEGVVLANGETLAARHVVLAIGHSSRDTLRVLERRGVHLDAKPFAIGFRIEHPQSLIDRARLGSFAGHPALGAADYKLVHHASNGRAVYSFCMCPGGTVVAATSESGRVVTNGMSQYSRRERNANAGIVVGINPESDYPGGPLAGIELQEQLEAHAFELGGGDYSAPVQLVGDFVRDTASNKLGDVVPSYQPGVRLSNLSSSLPSYAIDAIREALPAFGKQIRGFDRDDAVLTSVESTHFIARADCPRSRVPAKPERAGPIPLRRGRRLCRRYPVCRRRWYQGGGSCSAKPDMKKFDDLKKLQHKKYREACGHFLLEGEHLVQELQKAAENDARLAGCELYVTAEYAAWRSPFAVQLISARQMAQITETKTPQGIAALVPMLPASAATTDQRSIYLYQVQDPGNLGTILRTLAWFGGFRCLLSPNSVDPYNSKCVRASMGAIFHVPVEIDVPLEALPQRFARIAYLDTRGENTQSPAFKNFNCYLFGSEARGVPHEQLTAHLFRPFTIPGSHSIESLNLAAVVNMCAYEINGTAATDKGSAGQ